MDTPDDVGLFYVMLGECCDAARLGHVSMRLELDDGTGIEGVPAESAIADRTERQIDATGTRPELLIAGIAVPLDRVRRYTVIRPG